jgi:hypothetical protein
MKSEPGPPMTLGNAAAAQVRLIVWCRTCQRQVEPDPAEMAQRYGADTSVLDWREMLVCSRCGGRQADMVVTRTRRRQARGRSTRPSCAKLHPIDHGRNSASRRAHRGRRGTLAHHIARP